ncbi:twin-arginine translocation signal domain-containing protein, partial [Saccharopolyspora rosea]
MRPEHHRGLSRRGFLGLTATAATAAALPGCA